MLLNFIVNAQLRDWGPATGTGGCIVDGVPTFGCVEILFGNILFLSSALIVFALFLMLVLGAIQYLTSMGTPEKLKKAQGTIRMALIGFGIFVSAYLILRVIGILFLADPDALFKFKLGD